MYIFRFFVLVVICVMKVHTRASPGALKREGRLEGYLFFVFQGVKDQVFSICMVKTKMASQGVNGPAVLSANAPGD